MTPLTLAARFAFATLVTAAGGLSQVPQLAPFPHTLDLLIVDSTADGVWRLADRNQDGDYHDPGEITPFYDDGLGTIALTNPNCIAVSRLGTAFIGDSTVDVIVALDDLDGDGNALGNGEHRVFFDSASNAAGITMTSIQGLAVAASGEVFAAVSNTSSSGADVILRLEDLDNDGDANDTGEAMIYCQIPNATTSAGDSIPTEVVIAPDGNLYYNDVGVTGLVTRGVWQLADNNNDGDCNDPGEINLFWTPPAPGNAFYWSLAVDRAGFFYVTDHGNETLWRARDNNNDGSIDASEETLFYQTAGSTWWDVMLRPDGRVLVCEDQSPDRITELVDLNSDGDALDNGESSEVYQDGVSTIDLRPRGGAFQRGPTLDALPSTIQVGQSTNLVVTSARAGDLIVLAASNSLAAPTPLPPFGASELSSSFIISFGFTIADNNAQTTTGVSVPNDPAFVGSYAFQAFAGDLWRPHLSNAVRLTITP